MDLEILKEAIFATKIDHSFWR